MDLEKLTLDRIYEWPKSVRMAAIATICLCLVALSYWLDFRDLLSGMDKNKAYEPILIRQLKEKVIEAQEIHAIRGQRIDVNKFSNELLSKMAGEGSSSQFIADASNAAEDNHLEILSVKPLPIDDKSTYAKAPVKISVTGSYANIAKFLNALVSMPRIITFEEFSLGPKSTENVKELKLDLMVAIYQLPKSLEKEK
jgi:type IV pilus assembly protein PilO